MATLRGIGRNSSGASGNHALQQVRNRHAVCCVGQVLDPSILFAGRDRQRSSALSFSRTCPTARIASFLVLLAIACVSLAGPYVAQAAPPKRPAAASTVPALMISDVHFDPFHDPAKLQQLVDAPAGQWSAILAAPPSPNQQQAFDSLQLACKARGVDTPYDLLRSSLQAMRAQQPEAKFMTVSGDLIAHAFPCRYKTLLPKSTPDEYQNFVLKTIGFVMAELRAAFPGRPVYVSLGNNDSGCGDYQLDTKSEFLAEAGKILAQGLPASAQPDAVKQFAEGGYYSVRMAAPMRDTRLVVVNDVFLSSKYTTCGSLPDATAANTEMAWLQQQLTEAQQAGQRVWVMGHIPPGVNPYATISKMKNICGGAKPDMFVASGKMADLLVEHAAAIRLGIFAHTHMDELRLLQPDDSDASATGERSVAIKMAPSISPVDGNNPSFTVSRIDPATAFLEDYEVIRASNQTGLDTTWALEYDYARTYRESQFSPANLKHLIGEFHADRGSQQEISGAYLRNYFVGDRSTMLKPFWPQYVCALGNSTAKSYAACTCAANP
jgi:sphingomyelin phosphodiesterase acid-like 3